jgi:hypothetical protein
LCGTCRQLSCAHPSTRAPAHMHAACQHMQPCATSPCPDAPCCISDPAHAPACCCWCCRCWQRPKHCWPSCEDTAGVLAWRICSLCYAERAPCRDQSQSARPSAPALCPCIRACHLLLVLLLALHPLPHPSLLSCRCTVSCCQACLPTSWRPHPSPQQPLWTVVFGSIGTRATRPARPGLATGALTSTARCVVLCVLQVCADPGAHVTVSLGSHKGRHCRMSLGALCLHAVVYCQWRAPPRLQDCVSCAGCVHMC